MGIISDFIKDMPIAGTTRAQLIDFENEMAVLQKGNAILRQTITDLKKKCAELEAENADLKSKIKKIGN
jgi:predicted  nucleic acid-binding Zn-ribbon protein